MNFSTMKNYKKKRFSNIEKDRENAKCLMLSLSGGGLVRRGVYLKNTSAFFFVLS